MVNNATDLLVREDPLAWRIVNGQALIVNCGTNTWTRLNSTATAIFQSLAEPRTLKALADSLAVEWDLDVGSDDVRADVFDLVSELCALRIARPLSHAPLQAGRLDVDVWRDEMDAAGVELMAPTWAKIEVSTRCHLDCVHCYIPGAQRNPRRFLPMADQAPEMQDDEIRDVIDQLHDLGCLLLTFTGGEIFVRRGMLDLLQYAHDRGFILELFTSATTLTTPMIDRLAAMRVGRVQVSVYSDDEGTHDAVTQAPGSWRRSIRAVQTMIQRGLRVDLACSLMSNNYRHADATAALAQSLEASCSYGYPITARTDGNRDTHTTRLLPDELAEIITLLPAFFALPREKAADEAICPAGVNMCSITSTGDMLPCSQFHLPLGNVRRQPLRDIWESSPALQRLRAMRMGDLKPTDPSLGTTYVGLCPGLNLLEEGDFLRPAAVTVETTRAVREIVAAAATSDRVRTALVSGEGMRPESS